MPSSVRSTAARRSSKNTRSKAPSRVAMGTLAFERGVSTLGQQVGFARELDDVHSLPWLITAYLLASTAVVPLYGKIADIHGRLAASCEVDR